MEKENKQDEHDIIIVFKTLESARILQDELNGLVSDWSRDIAQKVSTPKRKNG